MKKTDCIIKKINEILEILNTNSEDFKYTHEAGNISYTIKKKKDKSTFEFYDYVNNITILYIESHHLYYGVSPTNILNLYLDSVIQIQYSKFQDKISYNNKIYEDYSFFPIFLEQEAKFQSELLYNERELFSFNIFECLVTSALPDKLYNVWLRTDKEINFSIIDLLKEQYNAHCKKYNTIL